MGWIYLLLAIVFELGGTISMKEAEGFTRLWPSIAVFVFYGFCLAAVTLAMARLPLGLVYAVWAGLGTAAISAVGIWRYQEPVTVLKLASVALIIAGVVGLNLSQTE